MKLLKRLGFAAAETPPFSEARIENGRLVLTSRDGERITIEIEGVSIAAWTLERYRSVAPAGPGHEPTFGVWSTRLRLKPREPA